MKYKNRLLGKIINISSSKTLIVLIIKKKKHKLYNKVIKKITKIHVHYEKKNFNIGDMIYIQPCKPISKIKRWRV